MRGTLPGLLLLTLLLPAPAGAQDAADPKPPAEINAVRAVDNHAHVTRERASELARMVLRENAVRLYGLKYQGGF